MEEDLPSLIDLLERSVPPGPAMIEFQSPRGPLWRSDEEPAAAYWWSIAVILSIVAEEVLVDWKEEATYYSWLITSHDYCLEELK